MWAIKSWKPGVRAQMAQLLVAFVVACCYGTDTELTPVSKCMVSLEANSIAFGTPPPRGTD